MTVCDLNVGGLRRRPGEDTESLLERIERDAGEILIQAEGSIPIVCAVFDQPEDVIQTLIDSSDDLQAAMEKGLQIRELRDRESRDAAVALKEFALRKLKEERRLITHEDNWPEDPKLFHMELVAILPQALEDYNGSVIQMAAPLNCTVEELENAIASDKKLQRKQLICLTKDEAAAEANFAEKAATGPAAGAHKFLTNRQPEKYGDKSQIDVKNIGFDVPPSGFGASILDRKKEDEE